MHLKSLDSTGRRTLEVFELSELGIDPMRMFPELKKFVLKTGSPLAAKLLGTQPDGEYESMTALTSFVRRARSEGRFGFFFGFRITSDGRVKALVTENSRKAETETDPDLRGALSIKLLSWTDLHTGKSFREFFVRDWLRARFENILEAYLNESLYAVRLTQRDAYAAPKYLEGFSTVTDAVSAARRMWPEVWQDPVFKREPAPTDGPEPELRRLWRDRKGMPCEAGLLLTEDAAGVLCDAASGDDRLTNLLGLAERHTVGVQRPKTLLLFKDLPWSAEYSDALAAFFDARFPGDFRFLRIRSREGGVVESAGALEALRLTEAYPRRITAV